MFSANLPRTLRTARKTCGDTRCGVKIPPFNHNSDGLHAYGKLHHAISAWCRSLTCPGNGAGSPIHFSFILSGGGSIRQRTSEARARAAGTITVQPLHRWPPRIREIASRNFHEVQVIDLPGVWGGETHALFFHQSRRRFQPPKDERGTSESRRKQRGCGGKAIPPRSLKQSYNARGWGNANRPGRPGRLGRLGHPGHRALPDLLREVREKHHRSNRNVGGLHTYGKLLHAPCTFLSSFPAAVPSAKGRARHEREPPEP